MHIGADLVVAGAGRVVQVPAVLAEELQDLVESRVRDANGVLAFQLMADEEAAVQVRDAAASKARASGERWRSGLANPWKKSAPGTRCSSGRCRAPGWRAGWFSR